MLRRSISDEGLALIKLRESCVLRVYTDRGGKQTVGWGHLLTARERALGTFSKGLTQSQADDLLRSDVGWVSAAIEKAIKVPLTQGQFDALTSLCFNCGTAPLYGTLGKLLNAGDYDGAGSEFLKWRLVNGKPDADLEDRRKKELDLWRKPEPPVSINRGQDIALQKSLEQFGDAWLDDGIPDDVA